MSSDLISESPSRFWGNILKSNSNGACFTLAIDNVNRNDIGYVDFEEMMGLDGIALVNIVSNPEEARVTNQKALPTRITHNDGTYVARCMACGLRVFTGLFFAGSTWKPLTPPKVDSLGRPYEPNGRVSIELFKIVFKPSSLCSFFSRNVLCTGSSHIRAAKTG